MLLTQWDSYTPPPIGLLFLPLAQVNIPTLIWVRLIRDDYEQTSTSYIIHRSAAALRVQRNAQYISVQISDPLNTSPVDHMPIAHSVSAVPIQSQSLQLQLERVSSHSGLQVGLLFDVTMT